MADGRPLVLFGDGTQARDYTYCDDIVAGVVAAVDWTASAAVGMEVFNLGGSRPLPLKVLVGELSAAMGMTPVLQWAPMQPGDVQLTCADVDKARRVLAFEARTPFAEGIQRFAAWFWRAYAGTTS
jgi:UDP-glucuronate 4-epimerase